MYRLPKQILCGETSSANCPQHKSKCGWRGCVSKDLSFWSLQQLAMYCSIEVTVENSLFNGVALMEAKLNEKARMLRDCHKGASSLQHSCY